MISPEYLASSLGRNVQIIKNQVDGLSHEDCLIQLPFRGNCMNWIIGHLVLNRNNILILIEAESLIDPISVERYKRDSDPITEESSDILSLDILMELLDQAQGNIANLLQGMTPDKLQRKVAFFGNREMTVGEWLIFFYFHDSYHTGQAEILRQATGTDDKII